MDPIISLPARTPFFPSDTPSPVDPLKDVTSGAVLSKSAKLGLDSLIILSVFGKWMGKTDAWEPHFAEAQRRGYNMLHWAPLQQRGGSGSPYSIHDQLSYDAELLLDKGAKDGGLAEVEKVLSVAREKYGLGGVTDVVLNHTAYDSKWLEEYPDSGMSLKANSG